MRVVLVNGGGFNEEVEDSGQNLGRENGVVEFHWGQLGVGKD